MRRVLAAGLAAGLLAGALPASPAAGQSGTITLSVVDASDTSTTVLEVGEDDGAQSLQVKAVASPAVSANATMNVVVGVTVGSTATQGGQGSDYTWGFGGSPMTMTINAGQTEGLSSSFTVTPNSDTAVEGPETIRITVTGAPAGYTVTPVDLVIADAELGTITLSLVDASNTSTTVTTIGEDGGAQSLQVKATVPAAVPAGMTVEVPVTVGGTGGTATEGAGEDYELGTAPTSVTINAGQTEGLSTSFTVTPNSDTAVEGAETIRVAGALTGYTVSLVDLVIADADFGSIVLSLVDATDTSTAVTAIGEDDGQQTLRVKAVAPAAVPADTTVTIEIVPGTAIFIDTNDRTNEDYTFGWGGNPMSVTISAGATEGFSANFTVTPNSDTRVEGAETIRIRGMATGYTVAQVDLVIADAELGTITLSLVDASDTSTTVSEVGEDGGAQSLQVKATVPAAVPAGRSVEVSVTVGGMGGTATEGAGEDYELGTAPTSVTINAGQTEGLSTSFTVTPNSDTAVEGAETIRVAGALTGYTVSLVDLVIADADFGSIVLSLVDATDTSTAVSVIGEDDGAQTLRVKATAPAAVPADTTVSIQISAGTAILIDPDPGRVNQDFTFGWGSNLPMMTISSGATEGFSANFTITPDSDTRVEGDETIRILGTAVGYTVEQGLVTIADADLPTVTLSFDDGQSTPSAVTGVAEEGGAQMVRVVATVASASTVAVRVALSVAAGTATETADYAISATSATVTIAANQTTGYSAALTVTPVSDTRVEGNETIVFSSSSGYSSVADASLPITDDDYSIELSVDKSAVLEYDGQQAVSVTAEFTGATTSDLAAATDVTVTVAGGSGMDGATLGTWSQSSPTGDFSTDQTGNQFTVSIGAGALSGSGSFNLRAHTDSDDESGGEKVALSGTATGATVTGAEITIHDAVVTLSFTDAADPPAALTGLGEDGGRQTVRVAAEVPVPVPADVDVTVTIGASGGTAAAGADGDYTTTASTTVVAISSGATSGSSGDLFITPRPDRVFEDHETIKFTGAASGFAVTEADLQIMDADRTLVATMNPGWVPGRTYPAVPVIEGVPYTIRETKDPRLPAQAFEVGVAQGGYGRPGITVSVRGVTSSTYSENLELRVDIFSGTAHYVGDAISGYVDVYSEAGEWFRQPRAGWDLLTINAGSLSASKYLRYDLIDWTDRIAEPDETFEIGAHEPDGFTVVNAPALIIDDDVQINLSSNPVSVAEGSSGTDVSISASMHADSSQITSNTVVSLAVDSDGAGLLAADEYSYTSLSSSVTVPAMATGSSTSAMLTGLNITDDNVVEGRERLRITGRPALAEGASQSVTFNDAVGGVWVTDDDANITLSVSPGAVVEKAGGQTVTVVAEFAGETSVLTSHTDVVVQIAGGTATLTTDFTTGLSNNRLTVRIPAGRTSGSKTFQLTAVVDSNTESSGETVTFEAHGTVRVGGGAVTVTGDTLTINDPGSEVTLSLTDASGNALTAVDEDGGAQTVRVAASVGAALSGSSLDVTVAAGALGGTAYLTDDFTTSASTVTVTIADGSSSGTADVTITPVSDTVTEDHETILFTGEATGYVVNPTSLRITDADRTLIVSMPDSVYLERTSLSANNNRRVDVSVSGETSTYSSDIRVQIGTSSAQVQGRPRARVALGTGNNDATHGLHSMQSSQQRYVDIGAGSVSGSTTFSLNVLADAIAEPVERFRVMLMTLPTGFMLEWAWATIVDRVDTAVHLNPSGQITEGGNGSGVNVTARFPSGVTSSEIASNTVVTLGSVTAGSAGNDDFAYTPPASAPSLTIPMQMVVSPGSGAVSLSGLSAVDDAIVEGPETVRLSGSYMLGDENREAAGTVIIADDDANIELSVSPETVVEGTADEITVTARFKGSSTVLTSDTTVTVTVASGDGTGAATLGSSGDFTTDAASNQVSVVIPAGALSGSASFNLTAATDSATEGLETGKLTGAASIGAQTLTVDQALVTIADPGRGITLAVDDADTGTSGTQTSVGEAAGTVTVQISAALPSGTNAPSGGTVVGVNVVGGTAVLDGDGGSFGTGEDFRVGYPQSQSPAPPSGHSLAVSIAAGANSGTATFTITLHDDDVVEGTETIVIEGGDHTISPTTYKVAAASLQVTDSVDDTAPDTVDLTLQTEGGEDLEEVGEADGTAPVRIRAVLDGTKVFPRSVTVPLLIGGGDDTATSGSDYEEVTSLSVTFLPHTREAFVDLELELTDDDRVEGAETLSARGGTLGAALTALGITTVNPDTAMVIDNDLIMTLFDDATGEPFSSAREGTRPEVRVRLSYPDMTTSATPRVVRVTIVGGTAVVHQDYNILLDLYRDMFFPIGRNSASDAFGLNLRGSYDDNLVEGDETLQVTAASPGFDIAPSTITITDNEIAPTRITMTASPPNPAEGAPSQVTVGFPAGSGALSTATAVTISATGGTAANSDYSISRSSVTIPAGATSVTFTVTTTNDSAFEPNETIVITARTDDYGTATVTITIRNDDPDPGGGGGGGGGAPPPAGGGGGGGGGGAPPPAGGGAPPPAGGGPVAPPAQPACQGRFCDEDGSVHEANIERIAAWEITLGCDAEDATKYCPSAQITRRQMAAFLYRAVSQRWTIQPPEGIEISDVPADAWYRTFADWVVSVEAFAAPNGLFNPGGVVTRADMAVMMIAAFPHLESVEEPADLFNDVEDLDPAIVRAVEGMYGRGVTRGCTAEPLNYCPDQPVTRAQMASFFVRAIDLVPAADAPAAPADGGS